MKSIVDCKCDNEAFEYPYLGMFRNGEVVLFTPRNTGVTVSDHRLGHYSNDWAENRSAALKGSVTLSND